MPQKLDYKFQKPSARFRARLYRDGRLFANGSAEVSGGRVIFYPTRHRSLAISPNAKIKLKVKKTQPLLRLCVPEIILDGTSSDSIWYFEIENKHA
jgi:hypothetical protein